MADKGLYQVLGPLEQTVMEYLWEHGRSNSTAISHHMNRYSSVSTTLRTLAKKGLLIREGSEGIRDRYFYTPRVTKEELMIMAIERLLWDLKATPTERQRVFETFLSQ